jgi:predicted alpha/beta superfamily hydrolase
MRITNPTAHPSPPQPAARPGSTITGDVRRHAKFRSEFLTRARDVLVYLPPGYERDRRRRHPVLYLQDGQNLFDGATSFVPGTEWRVDESAEALIRAGAVEPLIIVGIYNSGPRRTDEYTPTRDPRMKVGGKAHLYGRFLVEELKPFVDATYRTRAGVSDTGIGGSSLGGLVSLWLALGYPDVFGKLAALSPSVWWNGRMIVRQVESLRRRTRARIWLDMGTKESRYGVADARALRDALVRRGWRLQHDLEYREVEGGRHDESSWAERVPDVLRYLYPAR